MHKEENEDSQKTRGSTNKNREKTKRQEESKYENVSVVRFKVRVKNVLRMWLLGKSVFLNKAF